MIKYPLTSLTAQLPLKMEGVVCVIFSYSNPILGVGDIILTQKIPAHARRLRREERESKEELERRLSSEEAD